MILPKFDYYAPESLNEALQWLSEHQDDGVKILAGGTDLLVDMRGKIIPDCHRPRCQEHRVGLLPVRNQTEQSPNILLALSRIPELRGIRIDGSRLIIGAMTTISELERSVLLHEHLTGLCDGASQLGSPLVRNRGTFGGNLCNARPAADTAIPTLALGGKLVLVSVHGERIVNNEDFVTGPGKTIIEPDEILKEVMFDLSNPTLRTGSAYIKLANRKALEISVVGAAVHLTFAPPFNSLPEESRWEIADARIALGSVAPKPLLVLEASEYLIGNELTPETAAETARIASRIAKPITDHRGSREYRMMMVKILVRRALMICLERAFAETTVEVIA